MQGSKTQVEQGFSRVSALQKHRSPGTEGAQKKQLPTAPPLDQDRHTNERVAIQHHRHKQMHAFLLPDTCPSFKVVSVEVTQRCQSRRGECTFGDLLAR